MALKNLSKREDIIVKAADKGGALVVWRADLYQKEALRQLSDTCFYAKVDKELTSTNQQIVTSHAKTYTNGFPFSNGNPFTSRFSSVQLKFASVRTAWAIRSKRKSIRSNGCVIRSQKLPNRSNGWCTRSEKFASVRAVWSSVHKNDPSVRTVFAIRSEKLSIRSNACGIRSE